MARPSGLIASSVVLACLGVYALVQADGGPRAGSPPDPDAVPSPPVAPASPARPMPPPAKDPDIYSLLPFSKEDAAEATRVASRFMERYSTHSSDEGGRPYIDRLAPLVTAPLHTQLRRGEATLGTRNGSERSFTGTANVIRIQGVRKIPRASIIFLVQLARTISRADRTERIVELYTVTVVSDRRGWRAGAFSPESAT